MNYYYHFHNLEIILVTKKTTLRTKLLILSIWIYLTKFGLEPNNKRLTGSLPNGSKLNVLQLNAIEMDKS